MNFKNLIQILGRKLNLDTDYKELLKGGFSALFLKVLGMIIGYIIMIFLTNKFGAQVYGEYLLSITILSVLLVFSKFGLDISIVRIIGEVKLYNNSGVIKIIKKAFFIVFCTSAIVALIILAFSNKISQLFFNNENLTLELRYIAWIVFPATIILLVASFFQAYKKTILYILFNTFLINLLLLLLLLLFDGLNIIYRPFSLYSLSVFTIFIIAVIVLGLQFKKRKHIIEETQKHDFGFSKIINMSLPMLLAGSFVLLINWSDVLMLSIMSKESDVGIYGSAQKIADISSIMLFAVNAIATPKFIEFYSKKDMKGLERIVIKSTKLILLSSLPILIILICFSKSILSLNGPEFILGTLALILLCVGKFFNAISGSVGFILQMTNNQVVFKNVMIFAGVLNIVLNYLLIPSFGYNGAAFASMITVIVWNIILILVIKKRLGFWTFYNPFNKM